MSRLLDQIEKTAAALQPWREYARILAADDPQDGQRLMELAGTLGLDAPTIRAHAAAIAEVRRHRDLAAQKRKQADEANPLQAGNIRYTADQADHNARQILARYPQLSWKQDGTPELPPMVRCLDFDALPGSVSPELLALDPAGSYERQELMDRYHLPAKTIDRAGWPSLRGEGLAPLYYGASVIVWAHAARHYLRAQRFKQLREKLVSFSVDRIDNGGHEHSFGELKEYGINPDWFRSQVTPQPGRQMVSGRDVRAECRHRQAESDQAERELERLAKEEAADCAAINGAN